MSVEEQFVKNVSTIAKGVTQTQATSFIRGEVVGLSGEKVNIRRSYNAEADGVYYPVVPGLRPSVGDWVWALNQGKSLLIAGVEAEPGYKSLQDLRQGALDPRVLHANRLIQNSLTAAEIAALAIGNTELGNTSVSTGKLQTNAVSADKLAAAAVDTPAIRDNNVTRAKIAASAVDSPEINTNAVTTLKIAVNAVNADRLAAQAVDTAAIRDGNVSHAKLGGGSVDQPNIRDRAVTPAKLDRDYASQGHGHGEYARDGHGHTEYAPRSHDHAWGSINNKPNCFNPCSHTHGGSVATSLRFMMLPRSARRKLIEAREILSTTAPDPTVETAAMKAIRTLLLGVCHTIWDGLTETMAEREERLGNYDDLNGEMLNTLWEMYDNEIDYNTTRDDREELTGEHPYRRGSLVHMDRMPVRERTILPRFAREPHPDLH